MEQMEQFMPAISLRAATWKELVALAKRQQQRPDRLVERAVRDFLTRTGDEELLAKSAAQPYGMAKPFTRSVVAAWFSAPWPAVTLWFSSHPP
jgi:hypothetical protein